MAFRHGSKAGITINTKDLSSFTENVDFDISLDAADTTTFGSTWKSAIAGLPGATLNLTGFYDPTATTGPGAVLFAALTAGTPVTALYYPGGNVTGQILYTITSGLLVTGYSESSNVGGVVSFKATTQVVTLPVRTVI